MKENLITSLIIIVTIVLAMLGGKTVKADNHKHFLVDTTIKVRAYCTTAQDMEQWFLSGVKPLHCAQIGNPGIEMKIERVLRPFFKGNRAFWISQAYNELYFIVITGK